MRSKVAIIVAAIVIGLIAAFTATRYLNSAREQIAAESQPVEVLVAAEDVPKGTPAEEMLPKKLVATEEIPQKYVAEGTISSMKQVNDQVLAVPLTKGEQLTDTRFQFPSEAGLALSIPDNFLAVTIPVDEVKGVAGLIKPGDNVSVVATFSPGPGGEDISRILLPKAKILATGIRVGVERESANTDGARPVVERSRADESETESRTVTLALPPKDVEKLVFAEEKATVWLALLPTTATGAPESVGQTLNTVYK